MTAQEGAVAPPPCACGETFTSNPPIGWAYAFLYGGDQPIRTVDRWELVAQLDEVILDMGNDTPNKAAGALAYALAMMGWPEAEDIQAAVMHRFGHPKPEVAPA